MLDDSPTPCPRPADLQADRWCLIIDTVLTENDRLMQPLPKGTDQ